MSAIEDALTRPGPPVLDDGVGLTSGDFVGLLDAILEGFQVVDRELRYVHLNEAAARHGRTTKRALLGRTMMECYPGIEHTEVFAAIRRCLDHGEARVMENAFTFPDGSLGHFELRIEPVPQGASVLSIDVTARRNAELALAAAEERLRHAQRMEAVGQLAAGLAHDFNNLLTVILAEGERALARPEGPTRGEVDTMMAAARTSAELTRQLLAYGQRTLLDRRVVDVADVLGALEGVLRPALEPRIALRIDAPPGRACVEADGSQLEQIVMNLIWNARDAIEGEGRISVAVTTIDLDEEYVRMHPGAAPGRHAVITVSDTGAGMDEATRQRVFEPFFTTKALGRGTGLGLATVYGIVHQHGGNIWVYSEVGKGTTFKIYLRAADCVTARAQSTAPAAPRLSQSAEMAALHVVLVAEDSDLLRRLLSRVLVGAGYQVLLAESGEAALALWDRAGGMVSLLITDAMMPGMSGAELIERVRERRPDVPIICTSGYTNEHLAERGVLPESVAFIEKPFSPKVLLDQVRALLTPDE